MSLLEKRIETVPTVIIDTEATGLHLGLGHRLVEVGAVRLENGRRVGEFSRLINPGRPMGEQAAAVVGIQDEDLQDQPPFGEITAEFLSFIEGALLVAHNAAFDANFIGLELVLDDVDGRLLPDQPVLPNPWLCTLLLARRHFHFGRNHLGHVAHKLGIPVGRAHRALNDVYTTTEVFKRMVRQLRKNQRLETVADFLHAQGGAIYSPPPPHVSLLEPLATAVVEKRPVTILYIGESGENIRTIEPYYVVEHHGTAYIVAYCHLRKAQRAFRVDRIFNAQWPKIN